MNKKYILTNETKKILGHTLYRIKAVKNFGNVKKGDLGGFIEKEENLSHDDKAWVSDDAWVYGNARVCGNGHVSDNARVFGNALVCDSASVGEGACIFNNARVVGEACVYGKAFVFGNAIIGGNALVYENAWVFGDVSVGGYAWVYRDAEISSDEDYIYFMSFGLKYRNITFFKCKDDNIYVHCECFSGTIQEVKDKIKEKHGNSKCAREYLACIEVAKIHFEDVEE